jgi:uncharacterized Zn finger protein (UPF0148 family)
MSPSDLAFLKALGIKAEEVQPAAKQWNDEAPVYETCPECGGKRHRYLSDGQVFCLSCTNRKQREARYQKALAEAQKGAMMSRDLYLAQLAYQRAKEESAVLKYRGFEISHLNGVGWSYRLPNDNVFGHWMKAHSLQDAERRVDRVCGPEIRHDDDEIAFPLLENQCRGCGAPCGARRWCLSCARDKFL